VEELKQALVAYTPPHFETILCTIALGNEGGRPALLYRIECPSAPEDGTTVVNEAVHHAATKLVREMTPAGGTFPGIKLRIELQKDGQWLHSITQEGS
jgi:hypothetical protein